MRKQQKSPIVTSYFALNKLLLPFFIISILVIGSSLYLFSAKNSVLGVAANSYSLSFPADPMQVAWPTYPNSYWQIEAFLWADGDFTTIRDLKNLSTQWSVDPDYISIHDTDSVYFDRCPQVRKDLPCLMFLAHVSSIKPGTSGVTLHVYDENNKEMVWNGVPLVVYDSTTPTPVPSSYPTSQPTSTPTPSITTPTPTGELRNYDQEIEYLKARIDNQEQRLQKNESLVQKILNLLKRLFNLGKS